MVDRMGKVNEGRRARVSLQPKRAPAFSLRVDRDGAFQLQQTIQRLDLPGSDQSMVSTMPHSTSPDSTPTQDASQTDNVKPEPETQDVAMEDVPAAATAETSKVKLEEIFDDVDSDPEFPSSAPAPISQEDASQPAPMYAPTRPTTMFMLDN